MPAAGLAVRSHGGRYDLAPNNIVHTAGRKLHSLDDSTVIGGAFTLR